MKLLMPITLIALLQLILVSGCIEERKPKNPIRHEIVKGDTAATVKVWFKGYYMTGAHIEVTEACKLKVIHHGWTQIINVTDDKNKPITILSIEPRHADGFFAASASVYQYFIRVTY